ALTGFVGARLGLRRAYLMGIALFAVGGGTCAAVFQVIEMTPLRFVQGIGNGLILSAGMVFLWRAYPVHKVLAMALYGMGVFLPALAGAPLGGLLTTIFGWRSIFLINVPFSAFIALIAWSLLPTEVPCPVDCPAFDWLGLALLIAWIVPMNVVLDMG